MKKITKEEVDKVAVLARLEFKEEQKEKLTIQLNAILDYFDKLKELNTEGIDPMAHASQKINVFREDRIEKSINQEDALKNAPEGKRGYFRVPKIIE